MFGVLGLGLLPCEGNWELAEKMDRDVMKGKATVILDVLGLDGLTDVDEEGMAV